MSIMAQVNSHQKQVRQNLRRQRSKQARQWGRLFISREVAKIKIVVPKPFPTNQQESTSLT
jgi:hypothetical protein